MDLDITNNHFERFPVLRFCPSPLCRGYINQNRVNLLKQPIQPSNKVVQTEEKYVTIFEALDALKSGSRDLIGKPFSG